MPKALPIIDMNAPVCCSPVAARPLDDVAALEVAVRLKALADPMRLRLLSLILTCENEENSTTGALAAVVGLAESTVSHHLGQLRNAGLVASDRRGMSVHHVARRDALAALRDVLDPRCC